MQASYGFNLAVYFDKNYLLFKHNHEYSKLDIFVDMNVKMIVLDNCISNVLSVPINPVIPMNIEQER